MAQLRRLEGTHSDLDQSRQACRQWKEVKRQRIRVQMNEDLLIGVYCFKKRPIFSACRKEPVTMSTSVLSLVDRLTQKLGPISAALDATVEHLVPQKTASACSGIYCGGTCSYPGPNCGCGTLIYHYSTAWQYCQAGIYTCGGSIPGDCAVCPSNCG